MKDGLQFYRELDDRAKEYEEKNMVPDQNNTTRRCKNVASC